MFFILSKVIDFILYPITWILLCLLFIILSKNPLRKQRLSIFVFVLLLVLSNGYVVNTLYQAYEYKAQTLTQKYRTAIVLTGGMVSEFPLDGTHAGETADRFIQPMLLYKSGTISRILITGGDTSIGLLKHDKSFESARIKSLLIQMGIPADSILVEDKARNTYENALFTKKILGETREQFLLVTSASHMRRAYGCFQKVGLLTVPYPVNYKQKDSPMAVLEMIIPSEANLSKLASLTREIAGLFIYKLKGYN